MIFEIVQPFKVDPDHVYIKPLHCVDAWEAFVMLGKCFPTMRKPMIAIHGSFSFVVSGAMKIVSCLNNMFKGV